MENIHKNMSQREACKVAARLGVSVTRESGELVFQHPSFGVVRSHFGRHDAGKCLVSALRKAANTPTPTTAASIGVEGRTIPGA